MEALSALDTSLTGTFRRPEQAAAKPLSDTPRAAAHCDDDCDSSSVRYRRSDRTALYVETREGDIVRLRIKSDQSLRLQSAAVEDDETVIAQTTLQAQRATRLSLSVKGDLNDDELAALAALFEQASALAERFFAGDLPSVLDQAARFEIDVEQIATVALRLRSTERLTYVGAAPLPAGRPSAPAAADAPARSPSPAVDATAANEPAPKVEPPVAQAPAPVESERATAAAPDVAVPAPDGALYLFRAILDFLSQLLDDLERIEPPAPTGASDPAPPRIDLTLKLELFAAIVVGLSEQRDAEPEPGATFLPALADAVAAQSERLDTSV